MSSAVDGEHLVPVEMKGSPSAFRQRRTACRENPLLDSELFFLRDQLFFVTRREFPRQVFDVIKTLQKCGLASLLENGPELLDSEIELQEPEHANYQQNETYWNKPV
jgi:hypothetical protein